MSSFLLPSAVGLVMVVENIGRSDQLLQLTSSI
jgi:hypothetical protein